MKRTMIAAALAALTCCLPASADVVYTNGELFAGNIAYAFNYNFSISDSFTLSSATRLSGATIGIWTVEGTRVSDLDWSIGSSPFGTDRGLGHGSVSNAYALSAFGYEINRGSFGLDAILDAGTYWLTLRNGYSNGFYVYWDTSNGPSQAFLSNGSTTRPMPSHYFSLAGAPVPVPEPGTLALLVLALAGLGVARYAAAGANAPSCQSGRCANQSS